MKHYLIAILLIGFISFIPYSFVPSAFADHTATQPNAYVSYNSGTNEVQVEWDFTSSTGGSAPETCLLKGDFWFFTDLDNAWDTDQSESDTFGHPYYDHLTRITGFTPLHYSVVSSVPTIFDTLSEVIPCTGTMLIDIDDVMSNPLNVFQDGVTPREDLQIFLSFYSLHEDKDFTFDRIDEIFVFYTPDVTWSQAAIDYACAGQAGNTIYIDQSGINGNNGDNCDVYLSLDSNEWVDIGGANNGASLTDGETLFGEHVESSFSILIAHSTSTSDSTNGSSNGSGSDSSPPTLGINNEGVNMVSNGFSFNGNAVDVLYNHTPYPLIITTVGEKNTIELVIYENHGSNEIEFIHIGLGLKNLDTYFRNAEIGIDYHFRSPYSSLKAMNVIDHENLLQNVMMTSAIPYKCNDSDIFSSCLKVTFEYEYRESPLYNVLGVELGDIHGNKHIHSFNDGINVTGESLNPPKSKFVSGKFYTQIDKIENTWIDKQGIEFEETRGGWMLRTTPLPDYVCNDMPLDEINGSYGRDNCHFRALTSLWD